MPKNQPNLGRELAIHALRMHYQYNIDEIRAEIKAIQRDYTCDNSFIKKLNLKLQRTEINDVIVQTVLCGLPKSKQQFIKEKYKNRKSWIEISMLLFISKPQLNVWHNEILDELVNMMFYKILPTSIYCGAKVVSIIRILDKQIDILEKHHMDMVEPDILLILKDKKKRFIGLYRDMTAQFIKAVGNKNKILVKKMEFNNITSQQIALSCNVSESSVSDCLRNYRNEILGKSEYKDLFAV